MSSPREGFVTGVESVRGLAVLCVAIFNTMGFIFRPDYSTSIFALHTARDVVLKLFGSLVNSEMAVTALFVISGFAIGRSLDKAARSYWGFLVSRIFRLYPAHIVALGGVILLAALFLMGRPPIDFSPYQPIANPWLADWLNGKVFNPLKLTSIAGNLALLSWSMNPVVWPLYVAVCLTPVLPLLHRVSRRDNPYVDMAVVGGLMALCAVMWGQLLAEYGFVFYLGMIVQTRGREWARLLAARISAGLAAATAYIAMVAPTLLLAGRSPLAPIVEAFAAFSLLSVIVWRDKEPAFRFLDHSLLRWSGRVSYSFYLWHYIILTVMARQLYALLAPETMRHDEVAVFTTTLLVTVIVAFSVAQLSYVFVERPFLALGRKLVSSRRSGASAQPIAVSS